MKIWKYKDDKDYRENQYDANRAKLNKQWVQVWDIKMIAVCMSQMNMDIKSILCHGTRNGAELRFFETEYPRAKIIGTEIAPTASIFSNTIRHDFQKVHPKLIGKFNIVFSNSLDHSTNPLETLKVWRDQLIPNGKSMLWIDIMFDSKVNVSSKWDPLQWDSRAEFESVCQEIGLLPTFKIIKNQSIDWSSEENTWNLYGLRMVKGDYK